MQHLVRASRVLASSGRPIFQEPGFKHRLRLTRYRRAERLDVLDARDPLHALVVGGKCQPQVDAVASDVARDAGIQDRIARPTKAPQVRGRAKAPTGSPQTKRNYAVLGGTVAMMAITVVDQR
jgi:hypothetical protein